MKRESIVLFLLLFIPQTFAINVDYSFNQENVFFDVYKCRSTCSTIILSEQTTTATNKLTYNYKEAGIYIYAVYKECFYPTVKSAAISPNFEGLNTVVTINKQENCKSVVNQILTTGPLEINKKIVIKAIIKGPFSKEFTPSSYYTSIPVNRKEFLASDINIKLFINNNLVEEKISNMFLDETKEVIFNWQPATKGNYIIKIETSASDCKCINFQTNSKETTITISEKSTQQENKPLPISQVINNPGKANQNNIATCEVGDGCNPDCETGDLDCSCSLLSGYVCNEGETCKGNLMKNYDNAVCCSVRCSKGTDTNTTTTVKYFTPENKENIASQKPPEATSKEPTGAIKSIITVISVVMIFLLLFVTFALHHEHLLLAPIQKCSAFITKEKELFKKEKVKPKEESPEFKPIQRDAFIEDIIAKLSKDEAKIIKKLLEESQIRQEDLKLALGLTKERLEYSLIKLERRQIIKKRSGEDPKIELNEWLKS